MKKDKTKTKRVNVEWYTKHGISVANLYFSEDITQDEILSMLKSAIRHIKDDWHEIKPIKK